MHIPRQHTHAETKRKKAVPSLARYSRHRNVLSAFLPQNQRFYFFFFFFLIENKLTVGQHPTREADTMMIPQWPIAERKKKMAASSEETTRELVMRYWKLCLRWKAEGELAK